MTEQKNPIRVLLADDHPVVRSGMRKLLERAEDIQVVGEACDGKETLALVEKLLPDIVLLDMEMPRLPGVEVARQLRQHFPEVRILALSGHAERGYILDLLQLGVSGYLIKDESIETILAAVRGVANGETGWLSRRVSAQISNWMRKNDQESQNLTQRELEVLRLVVAGKTNQRISYELRISEKTIEKYLETIIRKLGVGSRVEAAVYAVRNKLLDQLMK